MTTIPEPQILNVRITKTLRGRIDDYRFRHRLKTESEAIRELLERGLSQEMGKALEQNR